MLAIIPIATFLTTFIFLRNLRSAYDWRRTFLITAVFWGTYLVLTTELLSIFHAIFQVTLVIAWLLPILVIGILTIKRQKAGVRLTYHHPILSKNPLDWLLLAGLVIILVTTALVAWLAPPQTWDSLNYHLPRVAYWAQNHGVQHYITGIDSQNSKPPGAEFVILHFYILSGGDRLANFVEWLAMLSSLVCVSWVAYQLGANRLGQFLAMIVTATIPTGIVQASSTMTDYVVAFWVLCAISEVLSMVTDGAKTETVVYASLAADLAFLTKPTAVPYLLPFILMAAWTVIKHHSLRQSLQHIGIACIFVLILNIGNLTRNYLLYRNPIGSNELVSLQSNQMMNVQGMLSNVLRNAGLHAGTPKQSVNQWVYKQVLLVHKWLGVDINDPRTTAHGQYNPIGGFALDEDVVGNLFHALLILASIIAVLIGIKKFSPLFPIYTLAVIATFFLFSLIFKWQIFGGRYHQAFFVLFSPIISIVAVRFMTPTGGRLLGVALIIAAYPWLFSISSRPLIPIPGHSYTESILSTPRQELYFANGEHLTKPYTEITRLIKQADCSTIGIMLLGNSAEYPLWVLLDAPRNNLDFEWIVGGELYMNYRTPNFHPCAIICESCPAGWTFLRGLPIAYDFNNFRLYLQTAP